MTNINTNNDLIDMWFPSRIDTENCPLDWFVIKYVYGLEQDKMPPLLMLKCDQVVQLNLVLLI